VKYVLRVRYSECDAQGVVFNARFAEYVDIAAGEYFRALFGTLDTASLGWDCQLVKQTVEWKSSARYDDVLELGVRTVRVGTTSFTLATEFRRRGEPAVIVAAETVYVMIDPRTHGKQPVTAEQRATFDRGTDVVVNHAG
jgi:acyl-CoA thioester hydrolase